MDEATEAEKNLRDQILQKLLASYRNIALASWGAAAIILCLVGVLASHFQIGWWFVLGLIPLVLGIQLFAEEIGVRFSRPKDRLLPAVLIGVAAFFSGAVIGAGTSWTDWIGWILLTIATGVLGLFRADSRAKLRNLEAFLPTFPNPQELEAYVLALDPRPDFLRRTRMVLVALVASLAIQPMVKLTAVTNRWALDRTTIQFGLQIAGKQTDVVPEIQFNGKPVHSGGKVEPGMRANYLEET